MTQKIAVAIVHGVGTQTENFIDRIENAIQARCRGVCGDDIIIRPVHWAPVTQNAEDKLRARVYKGGPLRWSLARNIMIDLVADGIAYQPTEHGRFAYDAIHRIFAQTMRRLADEAGPTAPLCIVAHSLGTIITSNYLYDLQVHFHERSLIAPKVLDAMGDTPLERAETLAHLYTLGSPLALWSLRYVEFGRPIKFPLDEFKDHYPQLTPEWINYYDADDIIAFPLKTLNEYYDAVVTADREVDVGNLINSKTPFSHLGYWTDADIIRPISDALIRTWRALNEPA